MPTSPDDPDPKAPSPRKGARSLKRFFARDSRDHLWAFLDILDARPALKKTLLIGVPAFLVAVGLGAWGYHHWERRNALAIARQWLAAGRLDRAGEAVQEAIATEPGQPQSWRLASELAWEKGNKVASVEYAKKAAVVGGYREDDVLAWAEASILADDADEAQEAEAYLDRAAALNSPRALRLAGEIARRAGNFATARTQFEAALRADTDAGVADLAADEVPLGIVCLQTGSAADRTRGRALLAKWASNAKWGADALRALLADAEARGDSKVTAQCAEALSVHPRCTLGDIPVCLQALAGSDRDRYQAMLAVLEEKSRATPTESAQLLGWLTKIGQGEEAVRWGQSLEPAAARKPPIAPGIAEALRSTQRWADLQAWVKLSDWGKDVGFLEMAYGMTAARHLGDGPNADLLLQSLNTDAALSPAHALFAGDALYAWGYPREAAALLWIAADQPDLAYQALGSLARLYQVQRDAAGQYRTFSRLNAMRPSDSDIANNYAYFAALTDLGSQTHIERIAADNFAREPGNVIYRSTDAFVLVWSGQASRALELMEPVASEAKKSPAVAFAYGAALAGVGRRDEAREIFNSLNPRNLSPQEIDWIQAALR